MLEKVQNEVSPLLSKMPADEVLKHYKITELYQFVLDGKLSKFPDGVWQGEHKETNAIVCIRYLFDTILKWDIDKIKAGASAAVLRKHKLAGPVKVFNGSPYEALNKCYPGQIKPWELTIIPKEHNTKEIAAEATRWFIETQLNLSIPQDLKKISIDKFRRNNLMFIVLMFDYCLLDMLRNAYPEQDIKQFQLHKLRDGQFNLKSALTAVQWFLEEHLKINEPEQLYDLTLKDFEHPNVKPAIRYFKGNYRKAIMTLYGETVNPWLFKVGVPNNYFANPLNRMKAVEWLVEEVLQYDTGLELYKLKGSDFKENKLDRFFADYYGNSLDSVLLEVYGTTREEYMINLDRTMVTVKLTPGELKQHTVLKPPAAPLGYMLNRGEIFVDYGVDTIAAKVGSTSSKNYGIRITSMGKVFTDLNLKDGDSLCYMYSKEDTTLYVRKI